MEIMFTSAFLTDLASAGIRMSAPLLAAALGELYAERSGVLNIGVEGMMLMGALFAVFGADVTGSPWGGVLAAVIVGGLMALIFAVVTISLAADQVVSGVAINLLALGLSTFLFRLAYGLQGTMHRVPAFKPIAIPVLSDVPVLGPVLFQHTPLVYLAFLLVPLSSFLLFRSMWGLSLRSVGEHPRAADTTGVNVAYMRYEAVIIGGAMAGLAGSILTLSQLDVFVENVTAGRGFIALAAVVFGQWMPGGAMISTLIFGLAEALQLRLQTISTFLPYQLLSTIPYVLTVLALIGVVGRARAPKVLGQPYLREEQRT